MSDFLAPQELREFARGLEQAGASIRALNMAASPHMLRNKDYELDIVRVGAALYGQQQTVPGTRSAARWLSRIATLKKVSAQMWQSSTFFESLRARNEELEIFFGGIALYGQHQTDPGTRSAARWLSRIAAESGQRSILALKHYHNICMHVIALQSC